MSLRARTLLLTAFVGLLAWTSSSAPPLLERGPYLQCLSDTGVTLVCRTAEAAAVTLRCGERDGPPWELETTSEFGTTHVFELDALRPETSYRYRLEAGDVLLGGGAEGVFRTSPPARSRAPFRFLAWGDSGTGTQAQFDAAARIQAAFPAASFALLLGDLVYDLGAWEDYDPKLFTPYADLFRNTPFWTALGNHEVKTDGGAPYFDAYYLPTTSGAPGHPSGTERYYSFDHGMAHFACVDSESSPSEPGSVMYAWLSDDLDAARARGQRWLLVFMHHPLYSRGTHDTTSEPELITLHDNLVPLLEAKGVDLVLAGHSHVYERSYLARDEAVLQGDATEYRKIDSPDGTVYLVAGCGGEHGTGPLDHPLMARGYGEVVGFSIVDVGWQELRGRFVERDGRTTDLFTLRKAFDTEPPRVMAVEPRGDDELALAFDEPVLPGAGPSGAENPARYALDPPLAVLGAELDSDASTVHLRTLAPLLDRAYTLSVDGVADTAGRTVDERSASVRWIRASDGAVPSVAVPRGSLWRYKKGLEPPPAAWSSPGFDDSDWTPGPAGFGYGYSDAATQLPGMQGTCLTLYLRTAFELEDPALVRGLSLSVRYDDGFVAFLNGHEIARANVPAGQTNTTPAVGNHGGGEYEAFDAGDFRTLLVPGVNVLAVEGHNVLLNGADFLLHPELVLRLDAPGGLPSAVLRAPVRTANAPAMLRFSAAGSRDEDGPLADVRWDFGDGSAPASAAEVQHLYPRPGLFELTLTVRDEQGNEALARQTIRIHDQGSGPRARLTSDATRVEPGSSVRFDAGGSFDPDGGDVSARWDFGDPASGSANFSGLAQAEHVFAAEGTFEVALVVTDDEGSSVSASRTIEVTSTAGSGSGSGGGGCSVAPGGRGGDPLLAAIPLVALLVLLLGRVRRALATAPASERLA